MVTVISEVPTLPPRARDAHKGVFGTVLVVAGSDGMLGAAMLTARGALRGGAGLVRACLPSSLMSLFTVAVPSATTVPREGNRVSWLDGVTAAVIGPGLGAGESTLELVRALLALAPCPIVLDADALNVLAPLQAPLASHAPVIITPHPREAARLLDKPPREITEDRRAAVLALAMRAGHIAVLKGAGTLVSDGERVFTCTTGNPGMATGGSGDVLAGLLGALLASGMDPFDAACLGVHAHGAAGDLVASRLSEVGLIAEDLPLAIAEVLRE